VSPPDVSGDTTGYVVVANADAGSTATVEVAAAVARLAAAAPTELAWTSTPDECVEVLQCEDERQLVIAGGDGSIHLALATITDLGRADRPVGIVPLGTGNDFARNHDIPLNPAKAADVIIGGRTASIDAMFLEGTARDGGDRGDRMVANNIHVGLGVRAARTASKLKAAAGRLAYPIATAYEGVAGGPTPLTVTADGEEIWDGPLLACLMLLGPSMGGGVKVIPDDDPDGERHAIEVVIVEQAAGSERLELVRSALRSRLHTADRAHHHRARSVTLRGPGGVDVNVDGEMIGYEDEITLTHRPDAWRVFLPEGG
jgi:diacylglycerol kinase family enzyme